MFGQNGPAVRLREGDQQRGARAHPRAMGGTVFRALTERERTKERGERERDSTKYKQRAT